MFMGVYSCTGPTKEGGVAGYITEWGCQTLGWGVHVNSNSFAVLKNTNTQLENSLYCYSSDWFDGTTSEELEETLETLE